MWHPSRRGAPGYRLCRCRSFLPHLLADDAGDVVVQTLDGLAFKLVRSMGIITIMISRAACRPARQTCLLQGACPCTAINTGPALLYVPPWRGGLLEVGAVPGLRRGPGSCLLGRGRRCRAHGAAVLRWAQVRYLDLPVARRDVERAGHDSLHTRPCRLPGSASWPWSWRWSGLCCPATCVAQSSTSAPAQVQIRHCPGEL